MEDLQEKLEETVEEKQGIESPFDLLQQLGQVEVRYRKEEQIYVNEYNKILLNTDWDKINDERKDKGLPKLSNQSMKEAYIQDKLKQFNEDVLEYKLQYNQLLRMYEMMRKYSLDILR